MSVNKADWADAIEDKPVLGKSGDKNTAHQAPRTKHAHAGSSLAACFLRGRMLYCATLVVGAGRRASKGR